MTDVRCGVAIVNPKPDHRGKNALRLARAVVFKYGLLAVLLMMIFSFSYMQPFFRTFTNAMFILEAAAIVAVIGLGCTISMTVGGFDLSVGASMSLSVMVASAAMVEFNLDGPVVVGLLNTALIVRARIPDL